MRDILTKCHYCKQDILRTKYDIRDSKFQYCCGYCKQRDKYPVYFVKCSFCMMRFAKRLSQLKKSGNDFCSRSCAASYNNTRKTTGTRRSKLEEWIELHLSKLFLFEIHFNRKDTINSELDIYIPSLSLAFELNGIFHYEPIYGPDKLIQIKNNDNRKFQACLERGIELCIIDTSALNYSKPNRMQKYLDIITNIINTKIGAVGVEPTLSSF